MNIELGQQLTFWALVPFAGMLIAIAVLPLVAEKWFHSNRNKGIVAAALGVPTVIYLFAHFGSLGLHVAASTAEEYVSFIVLLFALFTISGGVYLTGNLVATPRTNLTFLLLGGVLASLVGTMGASMLLIRPLLRANSERTHTRHTVIFFIFAVSNIGGMLTPLGDPPLFLGFLRGVPFSWPLGLWPQWLLSLGLTLILYLARRDPSVPARTGVGQAVGRGRLRAHQGQGHDQPPLLRPGDRHDPILGRLGAAWRDHPLPLRPRSAVGRAGYPLGQARTPGTPSGEPLSLGAHRRGGGTVRRDLRDHDPGPGSPRGPWGDHRPQSSLAVLLGHRRTLSLPGQRSRPIWPSRPRPRARWGWPR